MNRRTFLSLLGFAATVPPAAIAGVETTMLAEGQQPLAFAPRGVVVEMPPIFFKDDATTPAVMNLQMISTGRGGWGGWVALESDEGQAIARETALRMLPSNLRSDGAVRGRQHHPTDFPPKR